MRKVSWNLPQTLATMMNDLIWALVGIPVSLRSLPWTYLPALSATVQGRGQMITSTSCCACIDAISQMERPTEKLEKVTRFSKTDVLRDLFCSLGLESWTAWLEPWGMKLASSCHLESY